MARKQEDGRKVVCSNRRARHDYEIIDTLEAGIVLAGSEVKSLRQGSAQLVDAYAEVVDGEAWLVGANIAQYACSSYMNHERRRRRKLLLHAKELHKLAQRVREKGLTLVPLEVYFKDLRGVEPAAMYDMILGVVEKPLLDVVMKHAAGNQSRAAEWLGINRNTLRRKLLDHKLIK